MQIRDCDGYFGGLWRVQAACKTFRTNARTAKETATQNAVSKAKFAKAYFAGPFMSITSHANG